jgi:16S rRNA (cytosine1402-N4)-methyltransferase
MMTDRHTVHTPVMLGEVLEWSQARPGMIVVDGTLGGGGHSRALIAAMGSQGRLLGLDRDRQAVERTSAILQRELAESGRTGAYHFVHANYVELPAVLAQLNITSVDMILLDLGLSSDQLGDKDRGFSFRAGGPLDLRYNPEEGIPASRLLATAKEVDLADIIYRFGEERFSRRIAKAIVMERRQRPIETAEHLHQLIHRVVPGRTHGRVDAATRTFQALRIAVNRELEQVEKALVELPRCLLPGGRFLVISFHSLEDRLVKQAFLTHPCLQRLTKKPIIPSPSECELNPRARSAKLRVAERIAADTID